MKRILPEASHGTDLLGFLLQKIMLSVLCFLLVALALSAGCKLSAPASSDSSASLNESLAGVTVEGTAVDGRHGAQVSSNQYNLQIAEMPQWPSDVAGKRVKVEGKMRKNADGVPAIHEVKWEVIEQDETGALRASDPEASSSEISPES